MASDKPPLVLLHGVTMSARVWDDVIPLLTEHHQVVAPTAIGHRGGPPANGATTVEELVDGAERVLDELGMDKPHLVGNSLGGWMAIELARRGRASTVCALSPAGFWTGGDASQTAGAVKLRRSLRITRLSRPLLPVFMRAGMVRHVGMLDVANHGERLTPVQALATTDDLLGCSVTAAILQTNEELAPLDPLPCPITLAWAADDKILPLAVNGKIARERLPHAEFTVLPGVGHVAMIDDPQLVATTILATTQRHL